MKTNQKGFAPIIIVLTVIAVLAIGGAGAWYYSQIAKPNLSSVVNQEFGQLKPTGQTNIQLTPAALTEMEYAALISNNIMPAIQETGTQWDSFNTDIVYYHRDSGQRAIIDIQTLQANLQTAKQKLNDIKGQVPANMSQVNELLNQAIDINLRCCSSVITGIENNDPKALKGHPIIGGESIDDQLKEAAGYTSKAISLLQQYSPELKQVLANLKMNLAAEETTYIEVNQGKTYMNIAPDEPVITIKNLNSFDWRYCVITLNNIYKQALDFIAIPSKLGSGGSMQLFESRFTKSDGTAFNNKNQTQFNISVNCELPYAGYWEGIAK